MPRPRNSIPKFSVDRNGRAFTKVHGQFISLGRGDNPDSRRRYAEVLTAQTGGDHIEPGHSRSARKIREQIQDRAKGRISQGFRDCWSGWLASLVTRPNTMGFLGRWHSGPRLN